ncbi:MAG: hypothetical protein B1H06_05830 [Candidatus Cloacimonas sp. 4484_143]|nr:MAG: hypothetical protein B1H06_05830 [Candidatus Cloacimonas sp. 4484_143]
MKQDRSNIQSHQEYFQKFKSLYKIKRQFGPTSLKGRYLTYSSSRFNPVILYTLLKVYDPIGVTKKLLNQLNFARNKS